MEHNSLVAVTYNLHNFTNSIKFRVENRYFKAEGNVNLLEFSIFSFLFVAKSKIDQIQSS